MKQPFPVTSLPLISGQDEEIVRGGREQFSLLNAAFGGVKQVGVIGWGSQAPAQAQNLRDSFSAVRSSTKVVVGLRQDSDSIPKAKAAGFVGDDGTLGEMYKVINESNVVLLLIEDGAQARVYREVFKALRPGATLGLSHGFLEGHLTNIGVGFPEDVNVVMVAPKAMGPSVRDKYLEGSGHNASVAIHQDPVGNAARIALGWSVAIGSPVTFQTTIPQEWKSDLFGERAILLGGLWGMVEALYGMFQFLEQTEESAFENSVLALTSFISPQISALGLDGFFYGHVAGKYDAEFNSGFEAAYGPFKRIMEDIYENVWTGQEIKDVILATATLKEKPMGSVEMQPMWQVGKRVRDGGALVTKMSPSVAYTAGAYIAGVMAQFRVLRARGHRISEIINESLIEGTDSLIPYMAARGVAHMVDNCSVTARLGTRRWGPVFKQSLTDSFSLSAVSGHPVINTTDWLSDNIHQDVARCYELKPKVAIVTA